MAIPITKKIKLNLKSIKNRTAKAAAKEEIAEYLEDTILDHLSRGESPVKGERRKFKPLSKEYKEIKSKISGSTKPNMELYGDMLDDFRVKVKGNTLSVGFDSDSSEESKLKAENHNKFTKRSINTKVPKRRFIPKGDQDFRNEIMRDIQEIIDSYASED